MIPAASYIPRSGTTLFGSAYGHAQERDEAMNQVYKGLKEYGPFLKLLSSHQLSPEHLDISTVLRKNVYGNDRYYLALENRGGRSIEIPFERIHDRNIRAAAVFLFNPKAPRPNLKEPVRQPQEPRMRRRAFPAARFPERAQEHHLPPETRSHSPQRETEWESVITAMFKSFQETHTETLKATTDTWKVLSREHTEHIKELSAQVQTIVREIARDRRQMRDQMSWMMETIANQKVRHSGHSRRPRSVMISSPSSSEEERESRRRERRRRRPPNIATRRRFGRSHERPTSLRERASRGHFSSAPPPATPPCSPILSSSYKSEPQRRSDTSTESEYFSVPPTPGPEQENATSRRQQGSNETQRVRFIAIFAPFRTHSLTQPPRPAPITTSSCTIEEVHDSEKEESPYSSSPRSETMPRPASSNPPSKATERRIAPPPQKWGQDT